MSNKDLKHPKICGFQLIEKIGGGGFSTVYQAVNIEDHRVAACKVVTLTLDTTPKERKMLDKEIRVHSAMKHVNVLEFYKAVIVEPDGKTKYFPGIYMLMEIAAGGDLFDKIAPDVGISEEVAQIYFNQLVAGLEYIHDQGVCHRDLKPENLLLDAAGRLKISDFGLCSVWKLKETGRVRLLTERCGSLPYVAPELNSDGPYHAEPVDIWGVGVILFTLLAGNTPWDEPSSDSKEFRRYVNGRIFNDEPWNRIGQEVLSLIRGILHTDPQQRMTIAEIKAHPWCQRTSKLAQDSAALAQRLTQSLQTSGDIVFIDPYSMQKDQDGDIVMLSPSYQSQFTQTLLLFSQTQTGTRYTPHLTRFYSSASPEILMGLIQEAVQGLGVKSKPGTADPSSERLRLKVGGFDRRKETFKGSIEVEKFTYHGAEGSFCVMQRDQGNPISWRQLWKAIVKYPSVEPHVLRR